MKIEHLALMMEDPIGAADWYSSNLEMIIIKQSRQQPFAHFLADSAKEMLLEIFKLDGVKVPDYKNTDPQAFHLAFSVKSIKATTKKITSAGGTLVEKSRTLPNGDRVTMLRDPWGLPIQLVNRKHALL